MINSPFNQSAFSTATSTSTSASSSTPTSSLSMSSTSTTNNEKLIIRIPALSTVVKERMVVELDEESDDDDGDVDDIFGDGSVIVPGPRKIAGTKRVNRYRDAKMSAQGQQVFQSITAGPTQHDRSFEELRSECYSQASVAGRQRPRSVDAAKAPWDVLPPSFQPHADADMGGDGDVVMSDEVLQGQEL